MWCRGFCFFLLLATFMTVANAASPLVVRTVYQEGFPAKYNADDPARPGICIEVIRAMEKADSGLRFTGLDVRASTVRIMRMLETHEIDVFVGIGRTPERETAYTWLSPPVFVARPYLYVRREDMDSFRSMEAIRGLKQNNTILVNFGTVQDEYLATFPDLKVDRGGTDTGRNLQKLMLGRGRFYFGSDLNTVPVISSMGLGAKIAALPIRFPSADNYVVMSRNADPVIRERLQGALRRIAASGELERIFQRYLK